MSAGSGQFSSQNAVRPHLVKGGQGGLSAEVADLRADLKRDFAANAAIAVEEFTNPAAADTDAIKESVASAASIQTYSGSDLDGAVGEGVMSPPRNITITSTTHADIDAVGVVITGEDVNGDEITETINLTNGGGATDVGVKAFAKVTEIVVPAQSGTGGALEFGFGAIIGLSKKLKTRAGLATLVMEIAAGSKVTTGTIVDAATGAPNGTYEPDDAPNATRDYAIYYEYDATLNE